MRLARVLAIWVPIFATACGSSVPAPRPAPVEHTAKSVEVKTVAKKSQAPKPEVASPSTPAVLPSSCAGLNKDCYPPQDFVRTLCKKKYPGVAIVMFNKTAPWQHAYVKVKDVAPFNSLGGPSAPARLEFLEEVILLRQRKPSRQQQQMMMDLPLSYDVLRFDGTCSTLAEDEFMTKKPYVRPRYAPIIWQQIDGRIRQVLAQNSKVESAVDAQEAACHGTFLAGGGEPCKDATQQLARAIIAALSDGIELPLPSVMPAWSGTTTAEREPSCPFNQTC